jgi:hypothetical protein
MTKSDFPKQGRGEKKLHTHHLWNRNIEEIIEKVSNECRCVLDDAHLLHAPNQQKCRAHIWPLTMCVHCSHNPECIAWIFLSFIKHSFFLAPIVTSTTTWRYWVQHSIFKPMLADLCNFVFNIDDNTSRQEISNHCEPNEFLTLSKKHTEPMSSYLSMTNLWFVSFEEQGLLATASPHLATSQDGWGIWIVLYSSIFLAKVLKFVLGLKLHVS